MIKIGNAPCSFGVIENTEGDRNTYADVLNAIAETGYTGTELGDWGFMPTDAKKLQAELSTRELEMIGSWVSVRLYDADHHDVGIENCVRTARLLAEVGGKILVIGDDHSTVPERHDNTGRITPEMALDDEGWEIYTTGAMRVAEAVKRETGLQAALHPHGATFVETPAEVEKFYALTDPDLVGYVFDTGHYALGGGDPIEGLKKFADRIVHVHFKDFDPEIFAQAETKGWGYQQLIARGMFSELGQGVVDFAAAKAVLDEIGYAGWIVVEQDMLLSMGSPTESARRNREYLRSIGL